ncbi:MAG: hypothetical protein KDB00_26095, partial [Planctomycetales bacterium]|nr:hypothetical protein [Planctomycetales bacterium]
YVSGQQYSITALTDSSGTIKERYAYDAYGALSIFDGNGSSRSATAEGNRYSYTGREWGEGLGIYHFRARMYDPVCGRFLARDPIGYVDGASLNRIYIGLVATDPLGEAKHVEEVWSAYCDGPGECLTCKAPKDRCAFQMTMDVGENVLIDEFPLPQNDVKIKNGARFCVGHRGDGNCVSDINRSVGKGDKLTFVTKTGEFSVGPDDFDDQGNYDGNNPIIKKCLRRHNTGLPRNPGPYDGRRQCQYWGMGDCPEIIQMKIKTKLEYACECGESPDESDQSQWQTTRIEHILSL